MSHDALKKYGKGAALMLKMGYTPGKGLGENGRGIVEPIMPTILKRGEGIKVDNTTKMMSQILSDWSDSSEDEGVDNAETIGKSVDFNQSGTVNSEYNIPGLFEIVKDLLQRGIDVPNEIIRKAEESNANQDLSIRTVLFNLLKSIKADQPKLKYLEFEIQQQKLKRQMYHVDLEVMERFKEVLEMDDEIDVDKLINIPHLKEINSELKDDLVELVVSKIQERWQSEVNVCNFEDIVSLGELLDRTASLSSLQELSSTELIKIEHYRNGLKKKVHRISMNIIGTIILKPFLIKLNSFYQDWTVFNVNLGIGVYEEVRDSEILTSPLFDAIIVKPIIIPKLCISISDISLLDEVNWIIPWLELLPSYFDELVENIVKHYINILSGSALSVEQLLQLPLLYWLEIAQSTKLNKLAKKELFSYILNNYRIQLKKIRLDTFDLLGTEEVTVLKRFVWLFKKLSLHEYEDDVYSEIMLPLRMKYFELYEKEKDYESFLIYMIEVLTHVELLSDDERFIRIQESVRECCEHLNVTKHRDVKSKKSQKDFPDIAAIKNQYVGNCDKKMPNTLNKIVKPSIKEIVFRKCEENGIPIVPGRIKDGKQMYYIENKGNKYEIYFDERVMFANYNGMKDEPIGLDELM